METVYKCSTLVATGLTGGIISRFFGGFDMLFQALVVLMAVDIIAGIVLAVVYKCSDKTEGGKLCSFANFKGLLKKGCCVLLVIIAVHLDAVLNTNTFTRDAVIIAFSVNELISIMENMGKLGIKMPEPLKNALEQLKQKSKE